MAMVISLGGVVMIAKPSFLFGGKGINKLGLVLALMQVTRNNCFCLECCPLSAFIKCFHGGIGHQMQLLEALTITCTCCRHC